MRRITVFSSPVNSQHPGGVGDRDNSVGWFLGKGERFPLVLRVGELYDF